MKAWCATWRRLSPDMTTDNTLPEVLGKCLRDQMPTSSGQMMLRVRHHSAANRK
jgi:hypothetical protein